MDWGSGASDRRNDHPHGGVAMKDLRTRISDILFFQLGVSHVRSFSIADQLISELGLKQEQKHRAPPQAGAKERLTFKAMSFSRYVSEWSPDDE